MVDSCLGWLGVCYGSWDEYGSSKESCHTQLPVCYVWQT